MKGIILLAASAALVVSFTANAGVIKEGGWSASGCGAMPEAPVIDSSSADTFNQSIGKLNDWQKQVQIYHDCMVKEANTDSATINQGATAEQAKINEAVEKMNKEVAAGKKKVEQSSSSSSPSPSLAPPIGSMPGSQGY
jgi:hypothetical protein